MPSSQDLDNAIEAVMNEYKPDIKHDLGENFGGNKRKDKGSGKDNWRNRDGPVSGGPGHKAKTPKEPQIEYFSVRVPAFRILSMLEAIFRDLPAEKGRFYRQLAQSRRLQTEFHVTLIHRAVKDAHAKTWNHLKGLYDAERARHPNVSEPELGTCAVEIERIVWDNRIICFVVRLANQDQAGEQWETTNAVAHITVGTASQDVKPKESNDMLAKWMEGGVGSENIMEEKVKGNIVCQGSVRGVLSRF
jgi:tRNA ligase